MALAFLVAALAVPFLVFDSTDSAEGVETSGDAIEQFESAAEDVAEDDVAEPEPVEPAGQRFVVTTQEVLPDINRLAAQASSWTAARQVAIEEGLLDDYLAPPPSDTDLSLLPRFSVVTTEPTSEDDSDPIVDETVEESADAQTPSGPSSEPAEATEATPGDGDASDAVDQPVSESGESATEASDEEPTNEQAPSPEPADEPVEETVAEAPPIDGPPAPPAQVNGRVPPPEGGPTAAQWDELRFCESTHNYQAISPSGLYRGAYQFSQQTWDWVSGIHWPFLTGIDPIDAPPAWQDVMAYTLFAMRGWDQWPICGRHLL